MSGLDTSQEPADEASLAAHKDPRVGDERDLTPAMQDMLEEVHAQGRSIEPETGNESADPQPPPVGG